MLMIQVFWDVALCHLGGGSPYVRGMWCLQDARTTHTTQCHMSEVLNLQKHHCKNLKPQTLMHHIIPVH